MADIIERNADTAGLWQCPHCDAGFRRVNGVHIGSQRKGMIPDYPCARVFAVHSGNSTATDDRPYLAYVDGAPIQNKNGVPRRFTSAASAYRAACRAAPHKEHA